MSAQQNPPTIYQLKVTLVETEPAGCRRTHAAIIAAQAGIVGNPITHVVEFQSEPWLIARESRYNGNQLMKMGCTN